MGFVAADRVKEISSSTGTGDMILGGPVSGFQGFSSIPGIADQDTFFYAIVHQVLDEWETGIGRWNSGAGTISRLQVIDSGLFHGPVSFSAGTKDIFNSLTGQSNEVTHNRAPEGNVYIPQGQSLYVSPSFEIAAGKTVEIGADACLEIG